MTVKLKDFTTKVITNDGIIVFNNFWDALKYLNKQRSKQHER